MQTSFQVYGGRPLVSEDTSRDQRSHQPNIFRHWLFSFSFFRSNGKKSEGHRPFWQLLHTPEHFFWYTRWGHQTVSPACLSARSPLQGHTPTPDLGRSQQCCLHWTFTKSTTNIKQTQNTTQQNTVQPTVTILIGYVTSLRRRMLWQLTVRSFFSKSQLDGMLADTQFKG